MQGADFKSATAGQLVIIYSYLDKADSVALDLLWTWVEGQWQPIAYDLPPIEWIIQWLNNRNSGR